MLRLSNWQRQLLDTGAKYRLTSEQPEKFPLQRVQRLTDSFLNTSLGNLFRTRSVITPLGVRIELLYGKVEDASGNMSSVGYQLASADFSFEFPGSSSRG